MSIRRGHARVLFNEGAFAEDTMRSGRAGAETLREVRSEFERDGVEIKTLRRCDPEGRDGTKLPACFKVYLQTVYETAHRRLHGGQNRPL